MKEDTLEKKIIEIINRYRYSTPPDCGKDFLEAHSKQYANQIIKIIKSNGDGISGYKEEDFAKQVELNNYN